MALAGRPLPAIDGLRAATALHHDLTLVTRDIMDFEGLGVRLINPWEGADNPIRPSTRNRAEARAMSPIDRQALKPFADKYVWWKTPDEAIAMPERVIARVMDIGDYADVQDLARRVGDDVLRDVLVHAQAGQFGRRSWSYWHYRLGLADVDQVPPLPVRKFE